MVNVLAGHLTNSKLLSSPRVWLVAKIDAKVLLRLGSLLLAEPLELLGSSGEAGDGVIISSSPTDSSLPVLVGVPVPLPLPPLSSFLMDHACLRV